MTRRTIQTPAGPVVAAPLTYRIHCWPGDREVRGYALLLPAPWADLRLCARNHGTHWTVDHYATGMCATVMSCGALTLLGLARNVVGWLPTAQLWVMAMLRAEDEGEVNRLMRQYRRIDR